MIALNRQKIMMFIPYINIYLWFMWCVFIIKNARKDFRNITFKYMFYIAIFVIPLVFVTVYLESILPSYELIIGIIRTYIASIIFSGLTIKCEIACYKLDKEPFNWLIKNKFDI